MAFLARPGRLGLGVSKRVYSQSQGVPLTRVLQSKITCSNFSSSRLKSATQDTQMKLKSFAKKAWDSLGKRLQDSIIDNGPKCVVLAISGQGYFLYMKSLSERLDKIEDRVDKASVDTEKAITNIKTEVTTVSRSQDELEVKHEKLSRELRELNFLKELWVSAVYQESVKTEEKK